MKLSEQDKHITEFELNFVNHETTQNNMNILSGIMQTNYNMAEQRVEEDSEKKKIGLALVSSLVGNSNSKLKASDKRQKVRKKKYKFIFWKYLLESLISLGVTIGIMFLLRVAPFPYFQLFFMIGGLLTIRPISFSNILIIVCLIAMVISNYYLNVSILSYPEAIICYLALYFFKQKHKRSIFWILILMLYISFAFIIGGIYNAFSAQDKYIFYFIFPVIMLFLRLVIGIILWIIDKKSLFFIQLPLFEEGLFIGMILTNNSIHSIQFWYLIVIFNLFIINDRTQFLLRKLKALFFKLKRKPGILIAQSTGYLSLQSFHLVGFVFLACYLQLYSSPFTSTTNLKNYVVEWRLPLIVFAFLYVYEIMSIIMMKKRQDVMIIGYDSNGWKDSLERVIMLIIGLWLFYIGLAIGAYLVF